MKIVEGKLYCSTHSVQCHEVTYNDLDYNVLFVASENMSTESLSEGSCLVENEQFSVIHYINLWIDAYTACVSMLPWKWLRWVRM